MDPLMTSGSSKLGLWAYYYRYFSVIISSVLFVYLVNNVYMADGWCRLDGVQHLLEVAREED
jgi:hypothetical protein